MAIIPHWALCSFAFVCHGMKRYILQCNKLYGLINQEQEAELYSGFYVPVKIYVLVSYFLHQTLVHPVALPCFLFHVWSQGVFYVQSIVVVAATDIRHMRIGDGPPESDSKQNRSLFPSFFLCAHKTTCISRHLILLNIFLNLFITWTENVKRISRSSYLLMKPVERVLEEVVHYLQGRP